MEPVLLISMVVIVEATMEASVMADDAAVLKILVIAVFPSAVVGFSVKVLAQLVTMLVEPMVIVVDFMIATVLVALMVTVLVILVVNVVLIVVVFVVGGGIVVVGDVVAVLSGPEGYSVSTIPGSASVKILTHLTSG